MGKTGIKVRGDESRESFLDVRKGRHQMVICSEGWDGLGPGVRTKTAVKAVPTKTSSCGVNTSFMRINSSPKYPLHGPSQKESALCIVGFSALCSITPSTMPMLGWNFNFTGAHPFRPLADAGVSHTLEWNWPFSFTGFSQRGSCAGQS